MNSVRSKATSKLWTVDDFMPGNESVREQEMRCSTDEEILSQLMRHMPPLQ